MINIFDVTYKKGVYKMKMIFFFLDNYSILRQG